MQRGHFPCPPSYTPIRAHVKIENLNESIDVRAGVHRVLNVSPGRTLCDTDSVVENLIVSLFTRFCPLFGKRASMLRNDDGLLVTGQA